MKSTRRFTPVRPGAVPEARQTPLSDDRYRDLMQKMGELFAAAERDDEAERLAAIEDIKAQMLRYGLTAADLED